MRERIFRLHSEATEWSVVSNDGGTSDDIKCSYDYIRLAGLRLLTQYNFSQ